VSFSILIVSSVSILSIISPNSLAFVYTPQQHHSRQISVPWLIVYRELKGHIFRGAALFSQFSCFRASPRVWIVSSAVILVKISVP